MTVPRTAVLLLQMGGPRSLDEVEPYLERLFRDPNLVRLPAPVSWFRGPLARWVARRRAPEVRRMYAAMGGASPNVATTLAQARALEERLRAEGDYRCFAAMGYVEPGPDAALDAAADAGCERLVALSMFPHWCGASTGAALADLDRALRRRGCSLDEVGLVDRYGDRPGFLDLQATRTRATLAAAAAAARAEGRTAPPVLVVSAHGIPESYVKRGDPYVDEVGRSLAGLVERLPEGTEAVLCFQSRVGPARWVGPATDATLARLGDEGVRDVVVLPISFVHDHLETLYEVDVELAEVARRHGVVGFSRVPALQDDRDFVEFLAGLVREVTP